MPKTNTTETKTLKITCSIEGGPVVNLSGTAAQVLLEYLNNATFMPLDDLANDDPKVINISEFIQ